MGTTWGEWPCPSASALDMSRTLRGVQSRGDDGERHRDLEEENMSAGRLTDGDNI